MCQRKIHLPKKGIKKPGFAVVSFILILVLSLLLFNIVYADECDENYERGITLLERGEWQDAIFYFQEALQSRPLPDAQAATSNLKLIKYLPYFYLGQAYFYAGNYPAAVFNFDKSLTAGAILKTSFLPQLKRLREIAETMVQINNQQNITSLSREELDGVIPRLQNAIATKNFTDAAQYLSQAKRLNPQDARITILENWLEKERRNALLEESEGKNDQAKLSYQLGMDYFLLGQYQQAMLAFKAASNLDPDFSSAKSWLQKTQSEIERLKIDKIAAQQREAIKPEIIEKIIRETTAPVFAIRSPVDFSFETRAEKLLLSGQAGDDQGIGHIELTLNGEPL